MSHTETRKFAAKNLNALKKVVIQLGGEVLGPGKYKMYSSTETGFGIKLPNWRYPLVVNTETGEIRCDSYNGAWGDETVYNNMAQRYGVEAITQEAKLNHHKYSVEQQENGNMIVTVTDGGYAVAGEED